MEDYNGGEGEEEYVPVLTFRQHADNSDSESEETPAKGRAKG